ncbi:MAG: TVP38/TMEM64 family protein [Myxococcales bacterium]|nr:TVP38/TMEM64 family protein [Myxococcales bacterium]
MGNRLILFSAVLAIGALGYFGGYFQYLDPVHLRELLEAAGPWGPLAVIVLFAVFEPFGAPGAIFILASATLWPFWLAFTVNILGAIGAGMLGFTFARYLGRDWVEGRMPERLRKWDERLSKDGLPKVILFRLIFFLNPASHWALGLSRVKVPAAILGTAIGFIPGVSLLTYFGAELLDWFNDQPTEVWIGVAVAIIATIIIFKIRKRTTASASRSTP